MGSSTWNDDFYADRQKTKAVTGVPTFTYDADVKKGKAPMKAHDKLSPYKVTRESRDSAAHPASVAIGVIFDVTGSMQDVPRVLQSKLPGLMKILLEKKYCKDPQVLFGAVGDHTSDRVPLQMGQFESGVEMDEDITRFVLEGGGGGSGEESYQEALYFFAKHTSIDCWEKRQHKGYLFIIGDELPYPYIRRVEAETVMGDKLEIDIPIETVVNQAREKYHVFFIIPKGTSHYDDPNLRARWNGLLGAENVLMLEDPVAVSETIGLAIGLIEGATTEDTMAADLKDTGASAKVVKATGLALGDLAKSVALARVGKSTGVLPETKGHSPAVTRL